MMFQKRDDRAAATPIAFLLIIITTMVFEGLLFGGDVAEASFPTVEQPGQDTSSCGGWFGADFVCAMEKAIIYVINFFKVIFGVVAFFWNLITFGVPGAPIYLRVIIGAGFGGGIIWSIVTLIRGN